MGKLLGSSKIITGSLLSIGDDGFRLDGVIVGAADSSSQFTESNQGMLKEIFAVQKQFVFDIIDSLGITLTIEERDAIAEVPTESYLALLAYSRGLQYQQQGMHDAARQEFNSAVTYDANFSTAQIQVTKTAAARDYSASQQAVESFALSGDADLELLMSGLDSRLVSVILNSGIMPDATLFNLATSPPQTQETGHVVITVDLE